ncbi:hypothetical protein [Microbulbifer sp. MCCC 1A16149]|uniref:hypothetical protein n=1 Tax=Microbulbifer sp. MCCC 1A16149 TaxID=3411322 RepID=UPI003D100369
MGLCIEFWEGDVRVNSDDLRRLIKESTSLFVEVVEVNENILELSCKRLHVAVRQMTKNGKMATGFLAVVISLAAYYFGAAAFTPAVLLSLVSAPLAIISLFVKAWRLGLLALYFSLFALLTSPTLGAPPFASETGFIVVALVGLILAMVLAIHWCCTSRKA